jgi:hypothetical protein
LHDRGIGFDKINIEQPFRGFKVDVEGEIEKEKEYIIVELGELSCLGKFLLVQDEIVKEFWFDGKNWMYCLIQKREVTEKENLCFYVAGYFKSHCQDDINQISNCLTYGCFDCLAARRIYDNA